MARLSRGSAFLIAAITAFVVVSFLYVSPSSWPNSHEWTTIIASSPDVKYTTAPEHLNAFFPAFDPSRSTYKEWNAQTLRDLTSCLVRKNCGPNQAKIAILANDWFRDAIIEGWRGGEGVWSVSMYTALSSMGYSMFIAPSPDWEEVLEIYRMFPDLVKVVIKRDAERCVNQEWCIKSEKNPTGLPRWKCEFDMDFFPDPWLGHDFGIQWVITADVPEADDSVKWQYIPYTIYDECLDRTVVPLDKRPNSAWFFAKFATYAHMAHPNFSWNKTYFELASKEPILDGLTFKGAYKLDHGFLQQYVVDEPQTMIPGIHNMGSLGAEAFVDEMANTRVLVGIGEPRFSPSPYLALCLGTPFINPIKHWDHNNPLDRNEWDTQHQKLRWLDPPYVYHVYAGDYEGFVRAIHEASTTPTPRYINPLMTVDSVKQRMQRLMERDWKREAETFIAEQAARGIKYSWSM